MAGKLLMIFLIFGLAAGVELPGIIKKKQWREFTVYTVLFIFGLVITIVHQVFKINIAAITDLFINAFANLI